MAEELAALAPGLFTTKKGRDGRPVAVVHSARDGGNEKHLEKVRRLCEQERWAECLQLRKRKEHFIFTVESSGVLPPDVLVAQALDILAAKCDKLAQRL